ncbi:MAG: MFS transporter [Pseudomonadota bacterium]
MRLLISFAALFLSISLLQLSSGSIAPLDALSGLQLGFSKSEIGLLGSAHFFGFFIGCWWAPRLLGSIGHSRTFAVFAAAGAIGAIAHPLILDSTAWAAMRIMTGLCVAGCYTVIEAWMQAKVTNESRGRVMSVYRVVDISASSAAQLLIGVLEPASYVSYNLLAILCCACLFPLTLSTHRQPETPPAPRLRPIATALISPLGAAGVVVAGLTSSSFRMVSPIYGQEIGLNAAEIGYFLATVLLGGAIAQIPVGWIADKYDRRWVLIGLSIASIIVCGFLAASNTPGFGTVFVGAALFGIATYPIFSVSAAHTNDFTEPGNAVQVNASLMFLYGVGAIFSPVMSSWLIEKFGPSALFMFISSAHILLVVVSVTRMLARPTRTDRTRYVYLPRTSFTIGKLMRKNRENPKHSETE